jgi:HEAT repeat protein
VDSPELYALQVGGLEDREDRLDVLLNRAGDGDASAAATLRAIVSHYRDFHPSVYSRAMNRAGAFVDASLAAPLLAALADQAYGCQAWAAMGCRALRLHAAVPQLRILLDAADWLMRAEAAAGLGAAGDESVVPDLARALQHPVQSTREAAAAALAELGGQAALDVLWEEFDRSSSARIGYIASALARFGAPAVGRLNEVAVDPDPSRRYWAAVALGATGDPGVEDVLERLLEDDATTAFGPHVRVAAKQALRTSQRIQAAKAMRRA